MSPKAIIFFAAASLFLSSCRPKPISIDVPQSSGTLAISSVCHDSRTVYVSAGYSISSLKKLLDTSTAKELVGVPREMLVDSGIVTITHYGGAPDTLKKIAPGLFGRKDLQLIPGRQYSLSVVDLRSGNSASAITTYLPEPRIDTLYPQRIKGYLDTVVKLLLRMQHVVSGSHYVVSYNTPKHLRETATPLPYNAGAIYSFEPKQLELFTAAELRDGVLEKSITLQVAPTDTVFVQVGQIDKAYYDYLAAYKRTGALINQLTGEPINLPTNIMTGFGFFSLYQPVRRVYDLNAF